MNLVRDDTGETDLTTIVVEPNHPGRFSNRALDSLARASSSPIGVIAQVLVDRVNVDPIRIVVEHIGAVEYALHCVGPALGHDGLGSSGTGR